MKRFFIFIVACITALNVFGQEQSFYRHYTVQPQLINPGATGFEVGSHDIFGNFVNAWSGAPGTPTIFTLGYQGNVFKNAGFGAQVMSENNAAINRFKAALSYAYKMRFEDIEASIGLSAEYQQKRLRNDVINDPTIVIDDPVLLAANGGLKFFDVGLGLYAKFNKTFTLGASVLNLVHANIGDKYETGLVEDKDPIDFTVYAANRFRFDQVDFDLEPSIALRKVGMKAPILWDANLMGYFLNDRLIGGLSFLIGADQTGAGVTLGTVLNRLRLFYSYDIMTGDFQPYNNGKHEFTIGISIAKKAVSAQ